MRNRQYERPCLLHWDLETKLRCLRWPQCQRSRLQYPVSFWMQACAIKDPAFVTPPAAPTPKPTTLSIREAPNVTKERPKPTTLRTNPVTEAELPATFAMCTLLWCSISLSAKVRKVCTLAFHFGIKSRIITLSCSACSKSLICSTMLRQSVLPKQPGLQEPP